MNRLRLALAGLLPIALFTTAVHAAPTEQTLEPSNLDAQGEELLAEIQRCTLDRLSRSGTNQSTLALSQRCTLEVVVLDPQGRPRPDADRRMLAVLAASGVRLPERQAAGEARVRLQRLQPQERQAGVYVVPVRIAGRAHRFLLDTGASNSLLNARLAGSLGLQGTDIPPSLFAQGVIGGQCSRRLKISIQALPTLAVGGASMSGLFGLSLPADRIPGGAEGVLGLDFLSGFAVRIDPQRRELTLLPPTPAAAGAVPLTGVGGLLAAPVRINSQGPFTFGLDTGADLVILSPKLAARLGFRHRRANLVVRGFCGDERASHATLASLSLGGFTAQRLEAVILQGGLLERLGLDGIVGQNVLNRYRQFWHFDAADPLGRIPSASLELSPVRP